MWYFQNIILKLHKLNDIVVNVNQIETDKSVVYAIAPNLIDTTQTNSQYTHWNKAFFA